MRAGVVAASFADPAVRGMQTHLQGVERQPTLELDHQFPVDYELRGGHLGQERDDLRKITPQRLAGLCPQVDTVANLEGQAPKAIPFGFILPVAVRIRKLFGGKGFHRRRVQRKCE